MNYPTDLSASIRDMLGRLTNDVIFMHICEEYADAYSAECIRATLRYEWLFYETGKINEQFMV